MTERELASEKKKKHFGSVKVWLHNLRAEDEPVNPRQLDVKNVTRLVHIFRIEGCFRSEPQHRVPVLIDEVVARRTNLVNRAGELGFINLEPRETLLYLHGRHRLQAAKEFFPPADAWWVADLYSSSTCLKTTSGALMLKIASP